MAAFGGGWKDPPRGRGGLAHIEQGGDAVGQGNRAARILGFSKWNVHPAAADLFPFQPVTLFGPKAAIEQDAGHLTHSEPVFGLGWTLPTLGGSDSLLGARVRVQYLLTNRLRRLQVGDLLRWTEDPLPPALARQKGDGYHGLLDTSPFDSQPAHPAQHL